MCSVDWFEEEKFQRDTEYLRAEYSHLPSAVSIPKFLPRLLPRLIPRLGAVEDTLSQSKLSIS